MTSGRAWFLVCALAVGCGGDEFNSPAGGGGSAGVGGAAGSGAAPSGGGTAGGGGNGGSSTGATGGSAGTGASGGTSGSSGTAGTGGTLPTGPCGPPGGVTALFHSTLDDGTSITNPAIKQSGSGTYSGNFAETAPCAKGFVVVQTGEYANWPAQNNVAAAKGTIDFFFRPDFDKNDGIAHRIVGVIPSGFSVVKTDGVGPVLFSFGMGGTPLAGVDATNLPFVKGKWIRITLTWDLTTAGENARVYFDGQQAQLHAVSSGPQTTPDFSSSKLWLGAFGVNEPSPAVGAFDDLKVYGEVLSP